MSEYPYQLVAFLSEEPALGETVYSGKNGWYPQVALKRRFKFNVIDEDTGFQNVHEFCEQVTSVLKFESGTLTSDDRMPVKYIQIKDDDGLVSSFHQRFIDFMGERIESKFPDREGENYLPHITAEYHGEMVFDVEPFTNRTFEIRRICILKDVEGENSVAYKYLDLGNAT